MNTAIIKHPWYSVYRYQKRTLIGLYIVFCRTILNYIIMCFLNHSNRQKMYLLIYKSLPLNYYLDEVRFKSTIIRNYTYAKKEGMVQTQKHPYIPAKIVRQKERSSQQSFLRISIILTVCDVSIFTSRTVMIKFLFKGWITYNFLYK